MIITISGKTAVGKDTVGKLLSELTGFELFSISFKNYYNLKDSKEVLFFEKCLNSGKLDYKMDKFILEYVKKNKNKNLIVVSRLSGILLKDFSDYRFFLYADFDVRSIRLAKRENIPLKKAKKILRERDSTFEKRIRKIYGIIDYSHPKYYEFIINTNNKTPEYIADHLYKLIK